MRTIFAKGGKIQFEERPLPELSDGQVLIKSKACGICGSDLHLFKMGDDLFAGGEGSGELYLGHEFAGEIEAFGPNTKGHLDKGARVCSIPFVSTPDGPTGVGVGDQVLGAYSEYFVLDEEALIEIPEGVSDEAASLAEPLAVGIHAVARGNIQPDQTALVLGCGPIGLSTIAGLKMAGVTNIVASDPLESKRALAEKLGASVTIDPSTSDEFAAAVEMSGGAPIVVYECIGVSTLLRSIIDRTPAQSTLVVAGVHTDDVGFNPFACMTKEMNINFAFYYSPEEYVAAFQALAEGKVDWKLMVTGKVGFDGIDDAFKTLMGPNEHVKVVVEPWRSGALESV